jgi:hypothetical protein
MRARRDADHRGLGNLGGLCAPFRVLALLLALLLLAAALLVAGVDSAPDETFTMARAVIGAGGLHAAGAGFELDATAGQPAAGPAIGPDAGLTAGFWGEPAAAPSGHVYLPLTLR